jgi:hypothetical protein
MLASIIYKKKHTYEKINRLGLYLLFITIFITIFIPLEKIIIQKENSNSLLSIFYWESVLILILFTAEFYIIHKKSTGRTYYIYIAIMLTFSHITLSLFFPISKSTFIILFLTLLIIISLLNIQKTQKRIFQIFLTGFYFYLNYKFIGINYYEFISLLIIIIISFGYRPVINFLIHIYHSIIALTLGSLFILTTKDAHHSKSKFFITKVKITQIGRAKGDQKQKQKLLTWLRDYFRNLKANRVQITLSKNGFEFNFLIKTQTKKEGLMKGNQILTILKAEYKGLDGKVSVEPITNKILYKREKWYRLKIPKPPYEKRFNLLNHLITLFGEEGINLKLSIIWKKAPDKKVSEQKARIFALKYKDKKEKEMFLRMWREELFYMAIYINYDINKENILQEQAIEGKLKSLENLVKSLKKAAKIKRVSAGTKADYLRGIIPRGNYLTPLTLDFTFTKNMPIRSPLGLKKQVIDWETHRENSDNFPIGTWIDEYGTPRNNKLYLKIDHLVQGTLIVGKTGMGKTYIMGNLNKWIRLKRPEIGILIINFKREMEENIYDAEKVYTYGKNLQVPYIYPEIEGLGFAKHIADISQAIMGALGFEEEAVYACKQELENYLITFSEAPSSIKKLLKLTKDYFFKKGTNYNPKFRADVTSALETRINTHLSQTIVDVLNPYKKTAWYQDWINGKNVQINLTDCNQWELRLITILILQTIWSLTPSTGQKGLKNLIMIDEAHRILKQPVDKGERKSDDYVACERIGKIFEVIFAEFRDRGISFVLGEQQAHMLIDSAISNPNIKMILPIDLKGLKRLVANQAHIEYLQRTKERICVLESSTSGEFYSFRTLDYSPHNNSSSKCHNCGEINKKNAKFCCECGNKLK